MRMTIWTAAALLALAGASAPAGAAVQGQAAAQPQPRNLNVPARSAWQHAATGMILPREAGGLARREVADLGTGELDIVGQYEGTGGTVATVYLFRTAVPDVSLWFDRALTAVRERGDQYGTPGAVVPAAFARPGAAVPSGLRTAFDLSGRQLRSTALAVAPLGDFLVKVRLSAPALDQAGIDALLTRFVEGLRWPAPRAAEFAAAPVAPCAEPLRLRRARLVRSDLATSLLDALSGTIRPTPSATERPPAFCREPGASLRYGVYRPEGTRSAYLIALNDAGIALSVGPGLGALLDERPSGRVSMTLLERGSTSSLPAFNRLPPPEQAIAVAFGSRGPGFTVSTGEDRD
ncbi:MAG TPA: hypothetical protein VEZ20_10820 [Allosphingosinicella sp.]|nr:hypothetical protein [Allosphingosinicella sp.]